MIRLGFWEKANLLAIIALVGIPALTLAEFIVIRSLNHWLPVINALAFALVWRRFIKSQKHPPQHLQFNKLLASPLLWVFALQLIVVIVLFSAYLALPDVDPYHWIKVYHQKFTHGSLDQLPQRPLFHFLVYVLNQTLHIPSITVFKNIIPLISLTTLLPIWLVAKRFPGKLQQITLLLIPSLSPSLILHTQMGTPQALLIILTVFFVFFLVYAHLTQQKFWHYLAGIIIAIAAFYHGLALVMFAAWLIATVWHNHYRLVGLILLLIISFSAFPYLTAYLPQVISDVRLNLSFPTSFTTIDGVPNGWPGPIGLSQYYAFYLGLFAPVFLFATLYFILRQASYRQKLISYLTSSPAYLTLALSFAFYLSISEILPRLFNIIILPDRSWIFGALSSIVFLLILMTSKANKFKWLYPVLIFAALINISGALYVNNLKKHLIPDYAVMAAHWISDNAPASSLVHINGSSDYYDLHVERELHGLPTGFYCQNPINISDLPLPPDKPTYLFYYQIDTASPYRNRPWKEPQPVSCPPNALEQYPNKFKKIYDDTGQAIVWQVL